MNFFFFRNKQDDNTNENTKEQGEEKVTLKIYLDEMFTHSGDIFKAVFELNGPQKTSENIQIDFIVIYIYGLYMFNNEVINLCAHELINKQNNINLPFYNRQNYYNHQYLIFYTNSIILSSNIIFKKNDQTYIYNLELLIPSFIPPTYNGKNIKFKYFLYIQSVKRFCKKNNKQYETKKYEACFPIKILTSKYKNSPVLDFYNFPIKPYELKTFSKTDSSKYIFHNFRVKVSQVHTINTNEIENDQDNPSKNINNLEKTPFNSCIIPSYIYNNKCKSNLDNLLCIYNICLQRKDDSSLHLINFIVNNYSYFYFTHLFFYLIYHYNYYFNIIQRKIKDSNQLSNITNFIRTLKYTSCMNVNNNNNVTNNDEDILEEKKIHDMSSDVPTTLNNQINSKPFENDKKIDENKEINNVLENGDDIEIRKMKKSKHEKISDSYFNNILYDDKDLYNFYFCNYDNFEFNGLTYMPIRWFDNLYVKCQYSENDPDFVEKKIINNNYITYSDENSEFSENSNTDIETFLGSKKTNEYITDKILSQNMSGENRNEHMPININDKKDEKNKESEINFQKDEVIYYDKFIEKIETILNYMRTKNMFRHINRKKIKNTFPTLMDISNKISNNECNDDFDGNHMCVLKSKKNKNTNLMNIYKVNMNNKNVCIVTLMDKFQNKITNTFNRSSIININMNFEQAKDIYTIHADIYLKRVEKIKINTKFINLTTNKLYDDNDIIEKGNSTVSFEEEFNKNSNDNYDLNYTNITNTKIIFEKNVSILYCSNKNVTFILNEQIIPQFKNDLVKITYFIDINFYCLNKQYNTADLFGVNNNILDNIYNLNFKIPINVIETIYHTYENYSGIHFSDQTISQLEKQQLMLKYDHKLLYTSKEDLIKTVIL
ncbi:conserved Plasmodium protein, unknown function [Plasmodium berghei]|uniref:Uncharacterized protein n=2 Tax=Plasmodium berghei TaxID=5821 RepID=A0A509AM76_PLABA|nr:conserved Plasmodium protein, unknown function [Plasmodium berghei ANKA]CXI19807.1 conserved Plasmodium protein, unknown function [Plasmodium berghei]SCM19882.1 conserved Plasmodium protein, unknown function [Plasmodium berghei]SCN23609.1 conserved Plasmodium protein, unknown function [Plasmodium berghei]SCO59174.1 conserved Plasmodium protein, unknown function [Plasmodium berghei]SCO59976.1 conserved Plasmodium protein, unknown function [Plasmodium berghei]|eukprot:XP_034420687.1 conserved Plasmodium protein, unknown function [Plasmodium berghei ANKA]